MRVLPRRTPFLVYAFAATLFAVAPASADLTGIALPQQTAVTESVETIMNRELLQAAFGPLPIRIKHERPGPPKFDNAPGAPAVSQWPPSAAPAAPLRLAPQTVGTSFLGMQLSEAGFIPPDSMGDVGPTQILAVSNGRIKVFDKLSNVGSLNTTTDNFFASVGGLTNGTSDPHVRYDRLTGRWFICIITLNENPNHILLAVSTGPAITETSSFNFYSFNGVTAPADFVDYPTLGVDKFALYIGGNEFTGQTITRSSAYVIRKSDLIGGVFVGTKFNGVGTPSGGIYTPQGVSNDDPLATEGYFAGVDYNLFSRLGVYRVSNPGGTPALSSIFNLTVPTTAFPLNPSQPNIAATLDGIDDRLFAAAVHTNAITGAKTLWTAHGIAVNSTGVGISTGDRDGSRWYEIGSLTATPTLLQAGTLFDNAVTTPFSYWIPSVAVSRQGHMALGANRASTNATNGFASIVVAGRLRTDAGGTIAAPTLAQGSTFTYDANGGPPERWGDYSQTVVDPTDGQTMWTFQEYVNATNSWGVRVIKLLAPPPAAVTSASLPAGAGAASVNVTINGTSAAGSEFFDPGPDTGGPGFANHVSASVDGGVVVNSSTYLSPAQVRLNLSTVAATPGIRTVTITNPDGQSASGAILRVGPCDQIDLTPAAAALPPAREGVLYSQVFTQTGALLPATFTASGTIAGLTFNAPAATLSGTPTTSGTFPINITVTDVTGCGRTRKYSLAVTDAVSGIAPVYLTVLSGNGIVEPGQAADSDTIAPAWFNNSGAGIAFTGLISNWTGPGTSTYSIVDGGATYGMGNGITADCDPNCYAVGVTTPVTRPATHWDATLTELLSLGIINAWTVHVGNSFTDVPSSNGFYRFIETLLHKGVTGGCTTTTYCPDNQVTRAQMAVFLLRSKEGASYAPPPYTGIFSDVPNDFFGAWIEELARRGITGGCGPSAYCPSASVTRAQMAVFLIRAVEGNAYVPPPYTGVFTDVPNSFFAPFIEELARRGITSGCSGTNYCPNDPVTRSQMAVFLTRTFGLSLYGP